MIISNYLWRPFPARASAWGSAGSPSEPVQQGFHRSPDDNLPPQLLHDSWDDYFVEPHLGNPVLYCEELHMPEQFLSSLRGGI